MTSLILVWWNFVQRDYLLLNMGMAELSLGDYVLILVNYITFFNHVRETWQASHAHLQLKSVMVTTQLQQVAPPGNRKNTEVNV